MNLTQKISQMTPKGADLDATDLIEVSTIVGGSYVTKSITGQELIDAIPLPPTGLTVGTTPISSGTIGRVLFQGTGNVLQQSSSLFWDSTNNRLGIGTSSPSQKLVVSDTINSTRILIDNINSPSSFLPNSGFGLSRNGTLTWSVAAYGSNFNLTFFNDSLGLDALFINRTTNNIGINTTTDAGFRLDVNGTARVQSGLALNSSSTAFQVTGASSSLFRIRGFGDAYLEGSTPTLYFGSTGTFVSGGGANFYSTAGTGGTFFSVVHNNSNVAIRALSNSNVLLNPSAGNVLIGTTTDAGYKLDVNGTTKISSYLHCFGDVYAQRGTNMIGLTNWGVNSNNPTLYAQTDIYISPNIGNAFIFKNTGNLLINTTTDVASSKLTIESTTQGFLPPRMTTTQKNAIASPATGLQVYDTTLNQMSYYNGTTWTNI